MDFILVALAVQLLLLLPFLLAGSWHASGLSSPLPRLRQQFALFCSTLQYPFRTLLPSDPIQTGSCSVDDPKPDFGATSALSCPTASEACVDVNLSSPKFPNYGSQALGGAGTLAAQSGLFLGKISLSNFFFQRLQRLFSNQKDLSIDRPPKDLAATADHQWTIAASTVDSVRVSPKPKKMHGTPELVHPALPPASRALLAQKLLSLDRRIKIQRSARLPSIILEAPAAEEARN